MQIGSARCSPPSGRYLLRGNELDPEAADLATANLGEDAAITVGDAAALPAAAASVDLLLCDMPCPERERVYSKVFNTLW